MTTFYLTPEEFERAALTERWWAAASEAHLEGRPMEWLHV